MNMIHTYTYTCSTHYLLGICFVHSRALHTSFPHTGQGRSAPMRELDAYRAKIARLLTWAGRDQGTTAPSPSPLSLGYKALHQDPSLEPGQR